jgi:hypothetical protein
MVGDCCDDSQDLDRHSVDCAAGWCGSIFNAESTNGDAVEYHEVDSEFLAGDVDKNGWSFTFVDELEFGNDGSFVRLREAVVPCCNVE